MQRRHWITSLLTTSAMLFAAPFAMAETEAPDVLVKRISNDVMTSLRADPEIQKGNVGRIVVLVDAKIMPHVNFSRMTSMVVGRAWRQATPEQKTQLQDEFKTLLVRTYAGALGQVQDQSLSFKPMRAKPEDVEVVVRTEVKGKGDPIQLDYRLEKTEQGWKIYDLNVLGAWLVETYKVDFGQVLNAKGIDGLITTLVQRNKSAGQTKAS